MKRFVECEDRRPGVLLPEYLDDYVSGNNSVRVVDLFVDELDLLSLGFEGVVPEATGRPGYHPGVLPPQADITCVRLLSSRQWP
jgi:transposase